MFPFECDAMSGPLTVVARAKINLGLHILGKRVDRLHQLESLVCFSDYGDELSLYPGDESGLTISGPFAEGLSARDNLILDAVRLYRNRYTSCRVGHFHLVKRLPVSSGIGGGSADAAAALLLLDVANGGEGRADRGLLDIGALIGADVPVCLVGESSWIGGTGADVKLVKVPVPLNGLLVNCGTQVRTETIFCTFRSGIASDLPSYSMVSSWAHRDTFIGFLKSLRNDLEDTTINCYPDIGICLQCIKDTENCVLARMSGSGGTVYGIYEDPASVQRAECALRAAHPSWWVQPVMFAATRESSRLDFVSPGRTTRTAGQ